jgi:diacylglycerol kinase family enzyme
VYYYVYDEFIQDPKFERELALIETRLTDLGISGKIARLALFRDPTELIREEIARGAQTIVAVGNDKTLRRVIDAVEGADVVVGVLPMGKENNNIAHMLGMPSGVQAADVLSARRFETLDLGRVNGRRFLHTVSLPSVTGVSIACDEQMTLSPIKGCDVEVRNMALASQDVGDADPTDGRLELVLRTQQGGWFGKKLSTSFVPMKRAVCQVPKKVAALVDGEVIEGEEFVFESLPGQVRVITSRERVF